MTGAFLHDRLGTWLCTATIAVSLLPLLLGGPVSARIFAARGGENPTTQLAQATAMLAVAVVLWLLLQLIAGLRHRSPERPLRPADAAAALAPWALATASVLLTGSRAPNLMWLAVPAVIVALVIAQPDIRVLKVLGGVTIGLAALAVVVGLVNPEFASFLPYGNIDEQFEKAIFGTLLSWPFIHPNQLGMALVLGAPFVLYLRRPWIKAVGLAIITGGVLWASSRSAFYAGTVFLVAALLLWALRPPARAAVLRWGALALTGAVIALPLLTTDPAAFTQRGQIWQASLQRIPQAPLLGHGHFWYPDIGRFAPDLFLDATHGHNLMVHTLLTGGILGLAITGWLLIRLIRAINTYARAGDIIPGLYLLTWLTISIIEVPTNPYSINPTWFFTLLPLTIILVAARPPANGASPRQAEPRAADHPILAPDIPTPQFPPTDEPEAALFDAQRRVLTIQTKHGHAPRRRLGAIASTARASPPASWVADGPRPEPDPAAYEITKPG